MRCCGLLSLILSLNLAGLSLAEPTTIAAADWQKLQAELAEAKTKGDTAWMLTSSALVMLMIPGLALFYGGMVRRKNVLGTMMQSMIALALVSVFWFGVGYALAFGHTVGGVIGWSSDLLFLRGVAAEELLPGSTIPIHVHVLFQGMFAMITPALISGAMAERIRFGPYCLFILAWTAAVYCPLAHMVWAMNWFGAAAGVRGAGDAFVGLLGAKPGAGFGALDFAGGTVVHISAGFAGLAAIAVLPKRAGYPDQAMHPSSMVLTLLGAGLLWFGWFGFNGGSALASGTGAASAFAATHAAAAAAGLTWLLAEWWHRGKPTALGLASGMVAGLVAVTPASGLVAPWAGLMIGGLAGIVCYGAVWLKSLLKYDDSLDAFGVHGVGGFLGAVLTGVFWSKAIAAPTNAAGSDGWLFASSAASSQIIAQLAAAVLAAVYSFVATWILIKLIDLTCGLAADANEETQGLDRTQHGEAGFDLTPELRVDPNLPQLPAKAAIVPPAGVVRQSLAAMVSNQRNS